MADPTATPAPDATPDGTRQAPALDGKAVMVDAGGTSYTVDPAEVPQGEKAGWRLVTDPVEFAQIKAQHDFGGVAGGAEAAAEGLARGATLHGSDVALKAFGVSPERIQGVQAAHPYVSGGAEVAGAVLPVLATEGGAAPEEAAAMAAERGLAARAGAAGLRAATEGAGMQAAQNVSDAVFQDHPLTASAVFDHVGPTALLSGLGGAGIEGALGLASKYGPDAMERASGWLDRVAQRAEEGAPTTRQSLAANLSRADEHIQEAVQHLEQEGRPQMLQHLLGDEPARPEAAAVVDHLQGLASGMDLGDKGMAALERAQKGMAGAETLAEQFGVLSKADKDLAAVARRQGPEVAGRVTELQAQVGDALRSEGLFGPAAAWHADLESTLGPYKQARAEAKAALFGKGEVPLEQQKAAAQAYVERSKALLGKLEDGTYQRLGSGAEVSTAKLGADLDTLHGQAGRLQATEGHGLGQRLMHAGALHALLPHGAAAALHSVALPLGVAAGALKLMRGGQNEAIAKIASKAAETTRAVAKGIRDFSAGRAGAAVAAGKRDFDKTAEAVQQAVQQGTSELPALARHAPVIAKAMQSTAVAAATYLANALPKDPRPLGLVPPGPFKPSSSELDRFWSQVDAVTRPTSVLQSLGKHTVTPAQVDALRTVHGALYQRMADQLTHEIARKGGSFSYAQLQAASIFLGQPVEATQKQTAQLQQQFQAPPPQAPAGPPPKAPHVRAGSFHMSKMAGLQSPWRKTR